MFSNSSGGMPPLVLGDPLNSPSLPKFNIGDRVYWFRVATQDFGVVLERFYGTEGSVEGLGWHYTVRLDPDSPSFKYCKTDDGFEADLALVESGEANAIE